MKGYKFWRVFLFPSLFRGLQTGSLPPNYTDTQEVSFSKSIPIILLILYSFIGFSNYSNWFRFDNSPMTVANRKNPMRNIGNLWHKNRNGRQKTTDNLWQIRQSINSVGNFEKNFAPFFFRFSPPKNRLFFPPHQLWILCECEWKLVWIITIISNGISIFSKKIFQYHSPQLEILDYWSTSICKVFVASIYNDKSFRVLQ